MEQSKVMRNPWAGLSSYEDPLKSSLNLKFCGRENDTCDLVRLIDDNFFVTLYGKSGIGKTSLLNAGVFPALRKEQYVPVSLRLGMTDDTMTFQDVVVAEIEKEIIGLGGSVKVVAVVEECVDRERVDYLWNYFARHIFFNSGGRIVFPIVVLDQFEEVFRQKHSLDQAEKFLKQLHYLVDENNALNDCVVDGEEYFYDFNFRFVAAIREDDLYRLEDSVDNNALASLKRCRYRLRALSPDSAREVILVPGDGLIQESEKENIVRTIITMASDREGNISTNMLSLLCNRIFVDYSKSGNPFITSAIVDTFIKGNPFERFYNEATKGLTDKEKSYIEDRLVDSTGRRNSIPESDFLLHIKDGKSLLEGNNRIIQRTSVSSVGGNYRIELIHDSFCKPIIKMKQMREQKKKKKRIKLAAMIMSLGFILVFAFFLFVTKKNEEIKSNRERMQAMHSRMISGWIKDERSFVASLALLLKVLPEDMEKPDRPYTYEAGMKLKELLDTTRLERAFQHGAAVNSAVFSPDGKTVLTSSDDSTACIWNVETGERISVFPHSSPVMKAYFSDGGNIVVTHSKYYLTTSVWDACSKEKIKGYYNNEEDDDFYKQAVFSPDSSSVFIFSSAKIVNDFLYDIDNGEVLTFENSVYSVDYSPDGKSILVCSRDGVHSYDVKTGKLLASYKSFTYISSLSKTIRCAIYCHGGKSILLVSRYGVATIIDAETQVELLRFWDSYGVRSASCSPDGNKVVTCSTDGTCCLWNIESDETKQDVMHEKCREIILSPDGKSSLMISSAGGACLHDLDSGEKRFTIDTAGWSSDFSAFSPDGTRLLMAVRDSLHVWHTLSGEKLNSFEYEGKARYGFMSPDNKSAVIIAWPDMTVRVKNMATGEDLFSFEYDSYQDLPVFSPDGKEIIYAKDGFYHLVDVSTGMAIKSFPHGELGSHCIAAFGPDGKTLMTSSGNETKLWSLSSGKILKTLKHEYSVTSATFSPDGKSIAVGFFHVIAEVWNVKTGKKQHVLNSESFVNSVLYSSDGKLLLTILRDNLATLWNAETGEGLFTFKYDGFLPAYFNQSTSSYISFRPELKSLITTFERDDIVLDRKIRVWDYDIQGLIDRGYKILNNYRLSEEDRRKYYLE